MTLERHRAGEIWVSSPMPELVWLEANAQPGQAVFLFPDKGGQFSLGQFRNATRFPQMQDMGFSSQRQISEALADIERTAPAIGVWHESRLAQQPSSRSTLAPLFDGLAQHYGIEAQLPGRVFLLRRRD